MENQPESTPEVETIEVAEEAPAEETEATEEAPVEESAEAVAEEVTEE